jgi:hypothetical protein
LRSGLLKRIAMIPHISSSFGKVFVPSCFSAKKSPNANYSKTSIIPVNFAEFACILEYLIFDSQSKHSAFMSCGSEEYRLSHNIFGT